jgi:hypothetical protein
VGQEQLPAEDMAALRKVVLGFYEESIGRLVAQRRPRSWPPPGRAGARGRGGLARSAALVGMAGYRGAVSAALVFAEVVRGCFDLSRRDLIKQLGYAIPASLEDERRLWHNLASSSPGSARTTSAPCGRRPPNRAGAWQGEEPVAGRSPARSAPACRGAETPYRRAP